MEVNDKILMESLIDAINVLTERATDGVLAMPDIVRYVETATGNRVAGQKLSYLLKKLGLQTKRETHRGPQRTMVRCAPFKYPPEYVTEELLTHIVNAIRFVGSTGDDIEVVKIGVALSQLGIRVLSLLQIRDLCLGFLGLQIHNEKIVCAKGYTFPLTNAFVLTEQNDSLYLTGKGKMQGWQIIVPRYLHQDPRIKGG